MLADLLCLAKARQRGEDQRPSLLLPLLVLLCCPLLPQGVAAQQINSLYTEAQEKLRAGNFTEGCAKAKEVVEQDARNFGAYNLLGVCAVQRGDGPSAETYFRKSIEINPRYPDAQVNLAMQLRQRGQRQAAIAQLQKVLDFDPNNAAALYQLGKTEIEMGASQNAVTHLLHAHELSPDSVAFILTLADAYAASGQRDAASKLLESAIRRDLPTADFIRAALLAVTVEQGDLARLALAEVVQRDPNALEKIMTAANYLSGKGDYKNAITFLSAVTEAGDKSAEWNASFGFAEYKLGDPSMASEHLHRAIELSPETVDYYMKMGQLLLFYNSDQAAASFFKAGLQRNPNSGDLHFGLAVCYWAHQLDTLGAIEQLKIALKDEPDFQSALELLCVIYQYEKHWEQLGDTADRLIQADPQSGQGYYFKADVLLMTSGGDTAERRTALGKAYRLLQQSVRLDPTFSFSRVALGKILMQQGNLPQAIAEFQEAVKLAPTDSEGYYHLALAYREAGKQAMSEEVLNKFKQVKAADKEKERQEGLFQIAK